MILNARAAAHTGLHDHAVCLINRRERLLAQRSERQPEHAFLTGAKVPHTMRGELHWQICAEVFYGRELVRFYSFRFHVRMR